MSGSSSRSFTIDRDGVSVTVEVDYSWSGGSPAVTSGPPECCDPGENPEIEIDRATVEEDAEGFEAGTAIELSAEEENRFVEAVLEDDDSPVWGGDDDYEEF